MAASSGLAGKFSGLTSGMGNLGATFAKYNPAAMLMRGLDLIAQKIKTTDKALYRGKEVFDEVAHDMENMARTSQEAARIYNQDREMIAEGKALIGDASHTLAGLGLITGIATGDVKMDGIEKMTIHAVDASVDVAANAAAAAVAQSHQAAVNVAAQARSDAYRVADQAHVNVRAAAHQTAHQGVNSLADTLGGIDVQVPDDLQPGQR